MTDPTLTDGQFIRRGVGKPCAYCRRPMKDRLSPSNLACTRDHYVPKSKGGRDVVLACRLCNTLKSNMTPEEWRMFMAQYPEWWNHPDFRDIGFQFKPYVRLDEIEGGARLRYPGRRLKKTSSKMSKTEFDVWVRAAQWGRRHLVQTSTVPIPAEESKMILRHGKDYWKAWKDRNEPVCDCCRMPVSSHSTGG